MGKYILPVHHTPYNELYHFLIAQVVGSRGEDESSDGLSAIDYFGTGSTNGTQNKPKNAESEDERDDEVGGESGSPVAGAKRKQRDVERNVRKKKKKSNQLEVEGK